MERYHGKICSADGIGEDREVLLKFLHQLKNLQGPEQLESPPAIDEMGDISPHWQISPPSQRSLFPLKMGRGMLRVAFQPQAESCVMAGVKSCSGITSWILLAPSPLPT